MENNLEFKWKKNEMYHLKSNEMIFNDIYIFGLLYPYVQIMSINVMGGVMWFNHFKCDWNDLIVLKYIYIFFLIRFQ